ncbi:succinate dehydrogenase/fumarate reductase iron-sulfur subunit [Arcobacter peruensis]|uniref:succinate dehydrogenase/fumarate reductase iron-sulfur subunit n=1 Tax=Arcobacter peruensis TaxID=2320140 RepID=UPI000F0750AC|nr:2Fe-2S iron-sulfur cluster-binding protein [Arcobacter peruensis]
MKINIKRFSKENENKNSIDFFETKKTNLLQALIEIKTKQDPSLTFRCGCKSGVCGSCSVLVNGVEKLSCKTNVQENDLIEPLKNRSVIKDLVTDVSHETLLIKTSNAFLENISNEEITNNDIKLIDTQSNCILCNSCYSSCPVYDVNKEFLGPFALTRALRYVNDKKVLDNSSIIASIQDKGIWDCTLCSACTFVCPQGIDPKADIMQLQNISVQKGYENPNLSNFDTSMNFGSNDDFGFNPNGF